MNEPRDEATIVCTQCRHHRTQGFAARTGVCDANWKKSRRCGVTGDWSEPEREFCSVVLIRGRCEKFDAKLPRAKTVTSLTPSSSFWFAVIGALIGCIAGTVGGQYLIWLLWFKQ